MRQALKGRNNRPAIGLQTQINWFRYGGLVNMVG